MEKWPRTLRDGDFWKMETSFWKGGADVYREHFAEGGAMSFPGMTGLLDKRRTLKTLEGTPRWRRVSFSARRIIRPNPSTCVLIYRAKAAREGLPGPYKAVCISCHARTARGDWKLVAHQQVPQDS